MTKIQTANPPASRTPDAELIDLGHQLDLFVQRYYAAVARYKPKWDARTRLIEDWERDNRGGPSKGLSSRIADEIGLTAMEKSVQHPDVLMGEISPIAKAILAIPAVTIAGLSVKARLARFGADGLWDKNDADADCEDLFGSQCN
jgi:hypothetical protein